MSQIIDLRMGSCSPVAVARGASFEFAFIRPYKRNQIIICFHSMMQERGVSTAASGAKLMPNSFRDAKKNYFFLLQFF
jgi:hypothetical protein